MDHYSILGVSRDASPEELQKKYHDLVKQYHPDKLGDNPLKHLAEEKLKQINEAYRVLSDPKLRANHDRQFQGHYEEHHSEPPPPPDYQAVFGCHKHNDRPAVANCQFCGKFLCQQCASTFEITSCPECLSKYNRSYLANLQKAVLKPVIAGGIAFFLALLANSGRPADSLMFALYIVGAMWAMDIYKLTPGAILLGGLAGGGIGAAVAFVTIIVFGWMLGLVKGGINYATMLFHYINVRKKVLNADDFIKSKLK